MLRSFNPTLPIHLIFHIVSNLASWLAELVLIFMIFSLFLSLHDFISIFLSLVLSCLYCVLQRCFFIIRLPSEFLPVSGPTEQWCASALGAALLCSSRAGSDLGLYPPHTSEGGIQIIFLINRKMPLELAGFEPGAPAWQAMLLTPQPPRLVQRYFI